MDATPKLLPGSEHWDSDDCPCRPAFHQRCPVCLGAARSVLICDFCGNDGWIIRDRRTIKADWWPTVVVHAEHMPPEGMR